LDECEVSMIPMKVPQAVKIFLAALLLAGSAIQSLAQEARKLSLADAVAQALQNHPDVAAARLDIRAAAARVLQAAAFSAPEFTLSWDAMPGFFKPAGADERSISIQQRFEFPAKRKKRLDAVSLEQRLAEFDLQNVTARLTARVKKTYFRALLAKEQQAGLQEVAARLEQFTAMAADRYAAQNGSYLEVLRARVEKAKLANELISWRGEQEQALSALNQLLGGPGDEPLLLTDTFAAPPYDRTLEAEITDRWLPHARLLRGRTLVSQQQSFLEMARLGYWPDFSLAVTRQFLNGQPPYDANGFYGSRSSGWAVEIGISLPFFWSKGLRGESRQVQVGLDKSRLGLQAAERDVRAAIASAWRMVKTAEAQVSVFESSLLADSRDQLQAALELYRLNRLDSWQVLDALRSGIEIRNAYSQALYRFNLALTDLEAAGVAEYVGGENEEE
jgi:cobalt-zinc-cadmium efflux system outer membrane protein